MTHRRPFSQAGSSQNVELVTDGRLDEPCESTPRPKRNVLFVCSRNQWRSPTAEAIWRRHPQLNARSAGTSRSARRKVTAGDLRWADVILVMEEEHRTRLFADFASAVSHTPIHVLDIPDDYTFMDPELVEQLQHSVAAVLGLE